MTKRLHLTPLEYFAMPTLPNRVSVLGIGEDGSSPTVWLCSDWVEDKDKTPRLAHARYKHQFQFGWRVLWRHRGKSEAKELIADVYQPVVRVKMGRAQL